MIELALKEIEKSFGGNKIFNNITFEAQFGDRIGLIGRNGTGKTTILKIISGIQKQDGGAVFVRKNAIIGYLDQIPIYPNNFKVIDVLNTAFEEIYIIRKELKNLELQMEKIKGKELEHTLKKYSNLNELYESKGGYEIDEKFSKVCSGLKFNDYILNKDFISLSGGEKSIVMLGKILLQKPDILLLDEPSNHLDMESIEWLENYLKLYKGTVILISHDRYFLDKVVTKIIELENGEISFYDGNYSYYFKEKERRVLEQFEAYKDQQKKIKAMEKSIKQLRDWAIQGDNEAFFKRAESMRKRLDKIERIDKPVDKAKIKMDFRQSDKSGKDVINIINVEKNFDNKIILKNLNLEVKCGEKTVLIGNNGCGKSTIIKMILGEIKADKGIVNLGSNLKVGYLPQNITFKNEDLTVIEVFREEMNVLEGEARNKLAKFLFYGESVFKKVKNLSGGEKSRLKLCKLIQNDINLLILDEPTNHLDIDSREMLEEALLDFDGTILFVSHDRFFINKISKRVCEVEDKKITSYYGNYEYYKEKKSESNKKNVITNKEKMIKTNKPQKTRTSSSSNKLKELKQLEIMIENLEENIKIVDQEINKNESNYEKLLDLGNEREYIQKELNCLLEKWVQINS